MNNQTDIQRRNDPSDRNRAEQYVTLQQFTALRQRVDAIALKDDGIAYLAVNSTGEDCRGDGNEAVAIGSRAFGYAEECVGVGYTAGAAYAYCAGSIGVGAYAQASGECDTALGYYAYPNAYGAVALGMATATFPAERAVSIGQLAIVASGRAMAIGANATVQGDYSVALGFAATTERAQTVSVGNDTTLRFIARVAAGQEDDDAATVGQLREAGLSVSARGEVERALVLYDDRSKTRLTLPSIKVAGLRAADLNPKSTEMVAGSQLFKANQRIAELESRLARLEQAARSR